MEINAFVRDSSLPSTSRRPSGDVFIDGAKTRVSIIAGEQFDVQLRDDGGDTYFALWNFPPEILDKILPHRDIRLSDIVSLKLICKAYKFWIEQLHILECKWFDINFGNEKKSAKNNIWGASYQNNLRHWLSQFDHDGALVEYIDAHKETISFSEMLAFNIADLFVKSRQLRVIDRNSDSAFIPSEERRIFGPVQDLVTLSDDTVLCTYTSGRCVISRLNCPAVEDRVIELCPALTQEGGWLISRRDISFSNDGCHLVVNMSMFENRQQTKLFAKEATSGSWADMTETLPQQAKLACLSPNGQWLAVCYHYRDTDQHVLRIFKRDISENSWKDCSDEAYDLTDSLSCAQFSPNGKQFIGLAINRQIIPFLQQNEPGVWSYKGDRIVQDLNRYNYSKIDSYAFSSDSRYLVIVPNHSSLGDPRYSQVDATVFLYHFDAEGEYINTTFMSNPAQRPYCYGYRSASFSPDSCDLMLWHNEHVFERGRTEGRVEVYRCGAVSRSTDLIIHRSFVSCAIFSPNGKYLMTAGNDGKIFLGKKVQNEWQVRQIFGRFPSWNRPRFESGAFSANSQLMAVGARDGKLLIFGTNPQGMWSVKAQIETMGHNSMESVVFTREDRYLISVGPGQANVFEVFPERHEPAPAPAPASSRVCHSLTNLLGRFASRVANCLHHIAQVLRRFVEEIGDLLSSCCTCCPLISRTDPELDSDMRLLLRGGSIE